MLAINQLLIFSKEIVGNIEKNYLSPYKHNPQRKKISLMNLRRFECGRKEGYFEV